MEIIDHIGPGRNRIGDIIESLVSEGYDQTLIELDFKRLALDEKIVLYPADDPCEAVGQSIGFGGDRMFFVYLK